MRIAVGYRGYIPPVGTMFVVLAEARNIP